MSGRTSRLPSTLGSLVSRGRTTPSPRPTSAHRSCASSARSRRRARSNRLVGDRRPAVIGSSSRGTAPPGSRPHHCRPAPRDPHPVRGNARSRPARSGRGTATRPRAERGSPIGGEAARVGRASYRRAVLERFQLWIPGSSRARCGRVGGAWRQPMAAPDGGAAAAGAECRSDERVQPVLPGQGRSGRRPCGRRCWTCRTLPGTGPATTGWRSRRSTRRGSSCSTTTPGSRSSPASTARGTPTWRTSSPPGRRWRCSTSSSATWRATTGCRTSRPCRAFVLGAEQTAAAYARNYGGTVKEIRKAQRVNAAFQQVLDHPQAAEVLQHPALQPLLDEAARLARGRDRSAVDVGPHLRAARPRRPDRGHHRRLRVPEPRAARIASCSS